MNNEFENPKSDSPDHSSLPPSRPLPTPVSTPSKGNSSPQLFSAESLNSSSTQDQQDVDHFTVTEIAANWLHVHWQVGKKTQSRADSAMGREIYRQQKLLRLYQLDPGEEGPPSKTRVQQIELPNHAREWFLYVPFNQSQWEIELGLAFGKGKYFSLIQSEPFTLKETKLFYNRPVSELPEFSLADSLEVGTAPPFQVETQFLLKGETRPRAKVQIDDEVIAVDKQSGHFEWKVNLSNGRIVLPINVTDTGHVARALLAIEMNLHRLSPEPVDDL